VLSIASSGVSYVQTRSVSAEAAERKRITLCLRAVAAPTKALALYAIAEASVVQAVALRWTLRDRQLSGVELDVQGLPLDELVRSQARVSLSRDLCPVRLFLSRAFRCPRAA